MSRIDSLRYIFSDYSDDEIKVPMWLDYSFHGQESSLRTIPQAEQRMRELTNGIDINPQAKRDLRAVYGLVDVNGHISSLGADFVLYCNTTTNIFEKEFWLYKSLYNSSMNELRLQQIRRMNNIYKLLYIVPDNLANILLDGSDQCDKVIAFAEHLVPFPRALSRLFSLPWNDIVKLVTFNDNQCNIMQGSLLTTEKNLLGLLKRINTYNRSHFRRRIAIISTMIIPIVNNININGHAPFRVNAPFTKFFTRLQIEESLNELGYTVQIY